MKSLKSGPLTSEAINGNLNVASAEASINAGATPLRSLKKRNKKKGFTLVEILVTVALIALITAIAVPIYNQHTANALAQRKAVIIQAVADAKTAYFYAQPVPTSAMTTFDSATEATRFTTLQPFISINGAQPANLAALVANTGTNTMTFNNSSTAPTIP